MKKGAIIGLGAVCFVVVFAVAILGFGMIGSVTESNDNSINDKLLTQSANDYDMGNTDQVMLYAMIYWKF